MRAVQSSGIVAGMFQTAIRDLVKPQWVATLEMLKFCGGSPVSDLARRLDLSYMAVKQYCEDLTKLGYLERTRVPRTEVGRPEVFYRLAPKADALFPQAGAAFSLDLLDSLQAMFGESAPERLLFQVFQHQQERWRPKLDAVESLEAKLTVLAELRAREGCFTRVLRDPPEGLRMEEYHHPLNAIFARYPRTAGMELRMIEQLLATRVTRREIPGGRAGPARIDFLAAPAAVQDFR